MRPGATQLTVMPEAATSAARVLLQATMLERRALETPRFGMGWITPEDTMLMIRPEPRSRMPGAIAAVIVKMEATMAWNDAAHCPASTAVTGLGAGPPVLLMRMSIGSP